jgi:hypothetical protein
MSMPRPLNYWSGRSDASLVAEMRRLNAAWEIVRDGEGHSGSPGEGLLERIVDLEAEMKARGLVVPSE